jgi:hypothetical protein
VGPWSARRTCCMGSGTAEGGHPSTRKTSPAHPRQGAMLGAR